MYIEISNKSKVKEKKWLPLKSSTRIGGPVECLGERYGEYLGKCLGEHLGEFIISSRHKSFSNGGIYNADLKATLFLLYFWN